MIAMSLREFENAIQGKEISKSEDLKSIFPLTLDFGKTLLFLAESAVEIVNGSNTDPEEGGSERSNFSRPPGPRGRVQIQTKSP